MNKRFNNIDFLRFIFAILIVMYHFNENYNVANYFPGIKKFCICVDYFFIIAGFFLFSKIDIRQKTIDFCKKRFLRLAPMLWLFLFILGLISIISKSVHFNFAHNILRILLLHDIGFGPAIGGAGSVDHWFIAVLLWVSVFYFYITKIFDKKYLNLIVWMLIIFSYNFVFNYMHFNIGGTVNNIYYVFNIGILRALGGMGIGYFISELYKTGFLQKTTKLTKYIISFFEIFICGFLIYYIIFSTKLPAKTAFSFIVLFSIVFYLFLIRQGVLSKLLNQNFAKTLGSYSYALYVIHPLVPEIFKAFVHSNYLAQNQTIQYFLQVFCAVILAVITHYTFEKPVNRLIKRSKS